MSDEQPIPQPPKPSIKTSTVPLKKETVRISLRARPAAEGAAPAAPEAGAPLPPRPKPSTSSIPPMPRPVAAPAPTVPLRAPAPPAGGAPRPPGVPSAPRPAVGAPTVPLRPAAAAPGAPSPVRPASAAPTVPLRPVAAVPAGPRPGVGQVTSTLPQATTPLAGARTAQLPTRQLSTPTVSTKPDLEVSQVVEERDPNAGVLPFAIAALVLSLGALGITLSASEMVSPSVDSNPKWEKLGADNVYRSNFKETVLPNLPD